MVQRTHNRRSYRDFKSGSKRISKRRRLPGVNSPACFYPEQPEKFRIWRT
nr:MAG TPA: hypothetical protein [Bacteriophage sp.]